MCEPHLLQNRLILPSDDSKFAKSSSPLVHRKALFGTGITLENAARRESYDTSDNDSAQIGLVRHQHNRRRHRTNNFPSAFD